MKPLFDRKERAAAEEPAPEPEEPTPTPEEPGYARITIEDVKGSYTTDYAHESLDPIVLGNGEGFTLWLTIADKTVTEDDLYILYDDEVLQLRTDGPVSSETGTEWKLYFTGKKACDETQVMVVTAYEWETKGGEAQGLLCAVRKLNSADGSVVYITSQGERYHTSAACAGENGMKTTRFDAQDLGYTACKKCAA